MPYIGKTTDGFGVRNRFVYLATSGDTSVSGADANGATLTFTDGAYVDVYLNGVLLKPTTDYNTSTANTIAGLSALNTNDEVTVVVYDVFTVADMVSATSGGTFSGNVTFGGNVSGLDVNGTEVILDADGDTSITADTDDQIDIKIAGADDFAFKANTLEVQTGSNIGRYGERLNIWNRQGGNQLDPKTIARLGASMLLYEAGLAPSPEEALPRIVSNAQEVGGDITASIEKAIGKNLDTWISDTYSGADAITLERLKEAAIAIGFDTTSSKDLKRSIDSWIDVTFGTDKMVVGQRVDQDKVVGARTKYLNSSEIDKMNIAAYEAVYNSLPENDQLRLFRSRTNLELISSLVEPEIAGQKIVPQFELKFKESTAEPGIYYIYAKTDMGLIPLKDERFEGNIKPPLFLDAFDFQERENPHSEYGHYYTFYRSALQHDPNGAKFGNPSWMEYVAEKLGLKEPDINYGPSQATIDAESALIFARFPERINENREEFDRLVEKGVILESDVDEFLGYLND